MDALLKIVQTINAYLSDYILIILIVAFCVCFLLLLGKKTKSTPQKPKPQIVPEYDNEGYNRQGITRSAETDKANITDIITLNAIKPICIAKKAF